MPSLSSPWFQQKSDARPPVGSSLPSPSPAPSSPPSPRKLVSLSEEDLEALNARLSRPTQASRARQSLFWKMDSFMDKGRCSWTKMALFTDVKKSMWTNGGTVKTTCLIRPTTVMAPRVTQNQHRRPLTGVSR